MAETITQITQPPEFIEAAGKTYLTDLQKAIGQYKAADLSQTMGPQFVAGLSPLQQQAIGQAGGLGSYAPYLQQAWTSRNTRLGQMLDHKLIKLLCPHINKTLLIQLYNNMIFKHKKVYQH
jgi:hypothetical protein